MINNYIILFILFFTFLFLKMPVAFSLLCSSVLFMILNKINIICFIQRAIAGPSSFTLLAIGFFIFAGNLMNSGGITTKIFNFAKLLVGWFWGGLANANIVASIIFAGMSGSAAADVAGLGQIEIKAMMENGFDEYFSMSVTGASAIIGPIIPPSIPAVIFAVITGVSIGRLFIAGIFPGLVIAAGLMFYVSYISKKRNYPRGKFPTISELFKGFCDSFFALLTPIIVLGGIVFGFVTPTEASAIATAYALCLCLFTRTLTYHQALKALEDTVIMTIMILFIVGCASGFTFNISIAQVPQKLAAFIFSYEMGSTAVLFMIILVLVIIGCFMEGASALIILTPVFFPIATQAGIDPVHFGIVMFIALGIGMVTPPVGITLYILSAMRNKPLDKIAIAMLPFVIIVILCLVVIAIVPKISTFLPNRIFGGY